jgi:hypothetical protein
MQVLQTVADLAHDGQRIGFRERPDLCMSRSSVCPSRSSITMCGRLFSLSSSGMIFRMLG